MVSRSPAAPLIVPCHDPACRRLRTMTSEGASPRGAEEG